MWYRAKGGVAGEGGVSRVWLTQGGVNGDVANEVV